MANAIKLPGSNLEIFEKYPAIPPGGASLRLDFPGFADVRKSSCAKGVITEIKMEYGETPGGAPGDHDWLVTSLAKVRVNEVESDFIPLFYFPKKYYFDTTNYKSQDFDKDNLCYKAAWMSFRADDEVAVLLSKGKPVAILGFADGVPRPGEVIIKSVDIVNGYKNYDFMVSVSNDSQFTMGDDYELKDPDGKKLGLTKKCEIFPLESSGEVILEQKCAYYGNIYRYDAHPPDYLTTATYYYYDIWKGTKVIGEWTNFCVLVPVGPLIYRIGFSFLKKTTYTYWYGQLAIADGPMWPGTPPLTRNSGIYLYFDFTGGVGALQGTILPPDGSPSICGTKVACYTQEHELDVLPEGMPPATTLDVDGKLVKGQFPWVNRIGSVEFPQDDSIYIGTDFCTTDVEWVAPVTGTGHDGKTPVPIAAAAPYDESLIDTPLSEDFLTVSKTPGLELPGNVGNEAFAADPDNFIEIYTRPHTKEELQAAGLWPS